MIKKIMVLLCIVCLCGLVACKGGGDSATQSGTEHSSSQYVLESSSFSEANSALVSSASGGGDSSVEESSSKDDNLSTDSSIDSSTDSSIDSPTESSKEDSSSAENNSSDSSSAATKYVILLDANGGSVSVERIEVAYGEHFSLPTPERFEHKFLGWKIKGTDEYFTSGTYALEDNVELVADWIEEWSKDF